MALKRFAVTFKPKKDRFDIREIKKGKKLPKNISREQTSFIKAKTPNDALRRLSSRSFLGETGKKLKRRKKK